MTLSWQPRTVREDDKIQEGNFFNAIAQNSHWQAAGDLVVKELMHFDALYNYYQNGKALLKNDEFESLKESLTWEGSSIASLNTQEALFVTAIASSRRGNPVLDDEEYAKLKSELKKGNSLVMAPRSPDALEKLGLDTFMDYLH